MNIAFFLLPKEETVWLPLRATMRQAVEKMEHHGYTAVPILDGEGRYAGTLAEGDLLRKLKYTPDLTFADMEKVPLKDIPRRLKIEPIQIGAEMEDLISLALAQSFVPVVDDKLVFIGIIRRREIIEHYCRVVRG
ncbi:MAG: CBS domain-containing protein [Peptococcaceae bacterium]|nr:CBS domain-containing protein [Peptococcaceae bacterium]